MTTASLLLTLALAQAAPSSPAPPGEPPVRLGDLAGIAGMRGNALWGTGLVVGLDNTGDSAKATRRALRNLLEKHHLDLTDQDLKDGSAALVVVTAELPPFAREGDRLDVRVAATGGAKSLFGGTLLFTELYGADGQVWATAQGPLTVGGFAAEGQAAGVKRNHPTVATIHEGAVIEADLPTRFADEDGVIDFRLHRPDFVTASRLAAAVNARHQGAARAVDPSTVRVKIPESIRREEWVSFVAGISDLPVVPHMPARVVVNERTGTIVAGGDVRISTVAIAHGNLTIAVAENPLVSQPLPDSLGLTTVVPRSDVQATVDSGSGVTVIRGTTTIQELAAALNALGATPRDLITILRTLSEAGALHARLEVR